MLHRFLGPHYCELARDWVPQEGMRASVGTVGLVRAAQWWRSPDWVPYFNGKVKDDQSFLGGPVVKTLCIQGAQFQPLEWRSRMLHDTVKINE